MKRKVVKIGVGILIVIAIAVGGLLLFAYLMQDKIKQMVIAEINQNVEVPIQVKGPIEFSVFSYFPNGALQFEQIIIDDRLRKGKNLLKVEEFSFLIDLWSLLKDEIVIKKVVIKNGQLNIYDASATSNNYQIFKTQKNTTTSNNKLQLNIEEARMINIAFSYISKPNDVQLATTAKDWRMKGRFGDAQFELTTIGQIDIKQIKIAQKNYLMDKLVDTDFLLHVNQTTSEFQISKAILTIEKINFEISGAMQFSAQKNKINLTATSKGEDIADLIALIPLEFKERLSGVTGSGNYSISAAINGQFTKKQTPVISVNATLKDAKLFLSDQLKPLEKVKTAVSYYADSIGNDRLDMPYFSSYLLGQPFDCSLQIKNLSNPSFLFKANGVADLQQLQAIVPPRYVSALSGTIAFNHFEISGTKEDLKYTQNSKLHAAGKFALKNIQLVYDGVKYEQINAQLTANNTQVLAENFTVTFLNTRAVFNGQIADFLPYSYRFSHPDAAAVPLHLSGNLYLPTVDLSALITKFDKKNIAPKDTVKTAAKVNVRDVFCVEGALRLKVDELRYSQLLVKAIQTEIGLHKGGFTVNDFRCFAFDGEVQQHGNFTFSNSNELIYNSEIKATGLRIGSVFQSFNNFDQTTLTDKNIKGEFNATIQLKAVWDNYKNFNTDKLLATMDCEVTNGELNNYEPLKAASKFIDINDLYNIRFATLKNQLSIKDKLITIPKMEIQSSLVNLYLSGTHSFENDINYNLKINLKKVLASKFNRRNADIQYIEENPYDGINLYLSIIGRLPDYTIKYDKKGLKESIKEEFKSEKEELKMLFKKGEYKPPVDENEMKKEEKYFDTKQAPTFIDFDENKP